MPNDDEFEDLQAKMRSAGYRKAREFVSSDLDIGQSKVTTSDEFAHLEAYRTNEGTVILGSPADIAREKLSQRLMKAVDRTRKYELGPTIAGAEPLVGEPEDE